MTVAGENFLNHARAIFLQISEGFHDVSAIGRCENGRIKVGVFSSLASGFLAELLRAYNSGHDHVRIDVVDGDLAEHVSAIVRLELDVAFITGTQQWPGCETNVLWSERVFAVLPDGHALSEKDELNWSDLGQEKFVISNIAPGKEIYEHLVQRLSSLGYHPEIQPQRISRDNLLSLVAVQRGLTFTSEATTVTHTPGIVYRPIANELLPFSAVWSPRNDNPALRRLLSMARAMSNAAAS